MMNTHIAVFASLVTTFEVVLLRDVVLPEFTKVTTER